MVGISGIDKALCQGDGGMHIDANLIEGLKIGFALGVVVGIIGTFILSLSVFYAMRKKFRDQIGRDI